MVVNTGCANAGTGAVGLENARRSCDEVARLLGCAPEQVLPFSTGVILEHLPVERVAAGLREAVADLDGAHWGDAAEAIMTTDTLPKATSRRIEIDGRPVTVTGFSKGAGMIRPNMATMLGLIATDARIAQPLLAQWVHEAADASFNRITVDGDTSTNDSLLVLIATGVPASVAIDVQRRRPARRLKAAMIEVARNSRRRSCATARGRPSSSRSTSSAPEPPARRPRWPTRSRIRRW